MLGSGTHLGDFGNGKSPIVVLKSLAMNHWALWEDVETQFLHLIENELEGEAQSVNGTFKVLQHKGAVPKRLNSQAEQRGAIIGPCDKGMQL